jgi:uncharacterized delta-60 repeat protein
MKRWLLALGVVSTAFVACQQTPTPTRQNETPSSDGYRLVGSLEINFGDGEATTARFTPTQLGLQGGLIADANLEFPATSFTSVAQGGTARFLNAAFEVKNKTGATVNNLTVVAYHKAGNTADTSLKNVTNFQGVNINTYAQSIKPCHAAGPGGGSNLSVGNEDLMLLAEHEVDTLTAAAGGALSSGEYLFPYGFVARNKATSTSRSIPADLNATTGRITLCMRTDTSNQPTGQAYRFSLTALVFDNPTETTRVAESLEEQPSSGATARATAISATQIAALRTSNLLTIANGSRVNTCQVRTAGPQSGVLARLETGALTTTAGSFDACFGKNGKRTSDLTTGADANEAQAVAIDAQGRIVLVGYATIAGSTNFAVVRYNADGSLDNSFGTSGVTTFAFGGLTERAVAVTTDSSDRIVVLGSDASGSTSSDFAVARLDETGALDNTFSGDGKQTVNFGGFNNDYGHAVAIDSTGKIVVAGFTDNAGGIIDFAVARLLTDGSLDNTFDTDGRQTVDFATNADEAYAVTIGAADSIIVAGKTAAGDDEMAVAKLTSAGALDTTFDTDGLQTVGFAGGSNDAAKAVSLDSSGNVFVAGYTVVGTDVVFAVAKLTAAGVSDTTFDTDGKQTVNFGGTDEQANSILVDSSGRIVIVGTSDGAEIKFAVARLTAIGGLDSTFNGTGKLRSDYSGTGDTGNAGVLDADGKIVVVGSRQADSFGVVRINP